MPITLSTSVNVLIQMTLCRRQCTAVVYQVDPFRSQCRCRRGGIDLIVECVNKESSEVGSFAYTLCIACVSCVSSRNVWPTSIDVNRARQTGSIQLLLESAGLSDFNTTLIPFFHSSLPQLPGFPDLVQSPTCQCSKTSKQTFS